MRITAKKLIVTGSGTITAPGAARANSGGGGGAGGGIWLVANDINLAATYRRTDRIHRMTCANSLGTWPRLLRSSRDRFVL